MTKKEGRFNCKVDKELLEKYMDCVPNASEDIREYMQRRVTQGSTIEELEKVRIDLMMNIEQMNAQLDSINAQIQELKLLRQDEVLNKKKMMTAIETVKRASLTGINEGVSVEKVKEIAEANEVKDYELISKCKEQGIKFISKKAEEVRSTIQEENEEEYNKPKEQTILNQMLRQYKHEAPKFSNNRDKFLQDANNKRKYTEMCNTAGISFDEIVKRFKKLG